MNCLNGFFHDLYTTSLAERCSEAPGGAVAVWASSTLAEYDQQPMFDQEFLMRIRSNLTRRGGRRRQRRHHRPGRAPDLAAVRQSDAVRLPLPRRRDAGAADAAPPHDAGRPDAAQATLRRRDAGRGRPGCGGRLPAGGGGDSRSAGRPAETDAAADASHAPAGGGGCDCAVGDRETGSAAAAAMMLLGMLVAGARRRRGHARSQRRLTRWWPRRSLPRVLATLVLALGVAAGAQAQAAYGYRMDITLDRTRVGTPRARPPRSRTIRCCSTSPA